MKTDRILWCAMAAHEMNRVYCKSIGDASQPLWEDAPEWQRNSAIAGVQGALAGNTPEQQHQAWLDVKAIDGWKYGPVKDTEKKEHPCMVPYADLPEAQRRKDRLFIAAVRAMLDATEPVSP